MELWNAHVLNRNGTEQNTNPFFFLFILIFDRTVVVRDEVLAISFYCIYGFNEWRRKSIGSQWPNKWNLLIGPKQRIKWISWWKGFTFHSMELTIRYIQIHHRKYIFVSIFNRNQMTKETNEEKKKNNEWKKKRPENMNEAQKCRLTYEKRDFDWFCFWNNNKTIDDRNRFDDGTWKKK